MSYLNHVKPPMIIYVDDDDDDVTMSRCSSARQQSWPSNGSATAAHCPSMVDCP